MPRDDAEALLNNICAPRWRRGSCLAKGILLMLLNIIPERYLDKALRILALHLILGFFETPSTRQAELVRFNGQPLQRSEAEGHRKTIIPRVHARQVVHIMLLFLQFPTQLASHMSNTLGIIALLTKLLSLLALLAKLLVWQPGQCDCA